MLKKWSLLITLIATLSLTNCKSTQIVKSNPCTEEIPTKTQSFSLADYDYYSASVLPTITEKGKLYAILSREATGSRDKKGKPTKYGKLYKYDDFSGGKDEGETHPEQTAAHEFLQEAILNGTLGWDLAKTEEFINPENNNTWAVIAYSTEGNPNAPHIRKTRNVTYLVHFDKYKDIFFNNFHEAREKEIEQYIKNNTPKHHWTNAEKDMLAKVEWNDLKIAILNEKDPQAIVKVDALVMNPKTKRFRKQKIDLRPLLIVKLRPFLLDDADETYQQGEHEKIRHYQD